MGWGDSIASGLQNLATAPVTPFPGQTYYNTDTGVGQMWDAVAEEWDAIGGGGGGGDISGSGTAGTYAKFTASTTIGNGAIKEDSSFILATAFGYRSTTSETTGTELRLANTDTGGKEWRTLSSGSTNTGGAGQWGVINLTDDNTNYKLVISAAGNVAVGLNTPVNKFDVNGVFSATTGIIGATAVVNSTAFEISNSGAATEILSLIDSSDADRWNFLDNGNIDVGATVFVNQRGSGSGEALIVGYAAGNATFTTTVTNVILGPNAGQAGTTATGLVFVGSGAGIATTTGIDNVAIGDGALAITTIGQNNIAIGTDATPATNAISSTLAFGRGASPVAAGEIVFGSTAASTDAYTFMWLGEGPSTTSYQAATFAIQPTNITGTNASAAKNLIINCAAGTGTGTPSDIIFQSAPAGGSGSSANSLTEAGRIYGESQILTWLVDIEIVGATKGLILTSDDSTRWRLAVTDAGAAEWTSL